MSRRAAVGRAVTATAAMALGFLTVFAGFGVLTVAAASTVQRYLPYVTVVIGIALVALGIWLLAGREITLLRGWRAASGGRRRRGWARCLPTGSATRSRRCHARSGHSSRSPPPHFAAARFSVAWPSTSPMPAVSRSSSGSWRWQPRWPVRRPSTGCAELCRMSTGLAVRCSWSSASMSATTASTRSGCSRATAIPYDPVIAAAGRVQGAIAGWVHQHGAWPWLVALAVLTIAALGCGVAR